MSSLSRDLRDPKALGEAILFAAEQTAMCEKGKRKPLTHVIAPIDFRMSIPDYDGSDDVVTRTPAGADH